MQRSDFPALETDRLAGGMSDGARSASAIRSKRAVRIAVSLPVEIRDQFGGKDQPRTQFVMLRGCVLTTNLAVRLGDKIALQNLKSGRTVESHVVSVEPALNGAHQVELEFSSTQLEFWPVQFPAEDSRTLGHSGPGGGIESKPSQATRVSDKDLLVLADSVAHEFSIAKVHSSERIASRVASVDSVAQFRAANRAAHRREQRKRAFYSALFFAALSGGAVGARYWFMHRPELLAATTAPELRSVAQKIARALPAKASNAAQASAIDSTAAAGTSAPSEDQTSAPAEVTAPALISDGRAPVAQVPNQSSTLAIRQSSVQTDEADTQVAVRHGSTLATIRKGRADDPGEEPVALPLRVAETASLTKPEALKDVVADIPTHTAVLAAQVPKKAVPARLIHSVPAQYPAMARQLHVEGEVMLEVNVDATGAVSNVTAASGPPLLRAAAIDCVKRWKYQAATLGDKPVPSTESVKVDFHWR